MNGNVGNENAADDGEVGVSNSASEALVCFLGITDADRELRHFRFPGSSCLPDSSCLFGSLGNERGVLVTDRQNDV